MMKFTFADSRSPFGLLNNDEIYFCVCQIRVCLLPNSAFAKRTDVP